MSLRECFGCVVSLLLLESSLWARKPPTKMKLGHETAQAVLNLFCIQLTGVPAHQIARRRAFADLLRP